MPLESKRSIERAEIFQLPPVLILAFIREHQLLDRVQEMLDFGIEHLYISMDGPRNTRDKEIQTKILTELQKYESKFKSFKVRHPENNLGLKTAIPVGIDWFFQDNEFGIIIEDDIQLSEKFLEFAVS